jgi:hypothetical protein
MPKKSIPVISKDGPKTPSKARLRLVDATDVPYTQFFVNRQVGDEEEKYPVWVVSHKHSGWGILGCGRCSKALAMQAAKYLWDELPPELKDLLITKDVDGFDLDKQMKHLYKINPSIQDKVKSAVKSARTFIEFN